MQGHLGGRAFQEHGRAFHVPAGTRPLEKIGSAHSGNKILFGVPKPTNESISVLQTGIDLVGFGSTNCPECCSGNKMLFGTPKPTKSISVLQTETDLVCFGIHKWPGMVLW